VADPVIRYGVWFTCDPPGGGQRWMLDYFSEGLQNAEFHCKSLWSRKTLKARYPGAIGGVKWSKIRDVRIIAHVLFPPCGDDRETIDYAKPTAMQEGPQPPTAENTGSEDSD